MAREKINVQNLIDIASENNIDLNALIHGEDKALAKAEYAKIYPFIVEGEINHSVIRRLGEINKEANSALTVISQPTLSGWKKALDGGDAVSAVSRKTVSKPVTAPEAKQDGGRWLSKAEAYFFDAVLATMTDDDIENAQLVAQTRIAQEALAAIQEAAAREVNPMLEIIKKRRAEQLAAMDAPEAPESNKDKK